MASSPQGLRRLMLNNNVKKGIQFKYFDIQNVKNKWYAWYYEDGIEVLKQEASESNDNPNRQTN